VKCSEYIDKILETYPVPIIEKSVEALESYLVLAANDANKVVRGNTRYEQDLLNIIILKRKAFFRY